MLMSVNRTHVSKMRDVCVCKLLAVDGRLLCELVADVFCASVPLLGVNARPLGATVCLANVSKALTACRSHKYMAASYLWHVLVSFEVTCVYVRVPRSVRSARVCMCV
jgi:hypothetical protein